MCSGAWPERVLETWLTRLVNAMHGRIYGFTVQVAHVWAEQEHLLEKAGQRMPVEDSYIAATARRHGFIIVTGNDRDRAGIVGHRQRRRSCAGVWDCVAVTARNHKRQRLALRDVVIDSPRVKPVVEALRDATERELAKFPRLRVEGEGRGTARS